MTETGAAAAAAAGGIVRLRRIVAALIFLFAIVLSVQTAREEKLPVVGLFVMLMAVALFSNRGGRFLRDWGLIVLAFVAYGLAARAVPDLGLSVHYIPQIDAERALFFGELPTLWLQERLFDGTTGALEVFSMVMYSSHFFAPLLLAFLLWSVWKGRGFTELLFGLLAVSVLGEITFLLAPTAPPWLAADERLIPEVHHVIKQGLYDVGLTELATRKDDPASYNVVAAIPSLHIAWPVVGLLVIRKYRLPRALLAAQVLLIAGVLFAIVYTGEHYVVDGIVGAAYAVAAWWLVERALRVGRRGRSEGAQGAGVDLEVERRLEHDGIAVDRGVHTAPGVDDAKGPRGPIGSSVRVGGPAGDRPRE
jgi:hypothetical protein